MADTTGRTWASAATGQPARQPLPRYLTVAWVLLLLLGLFPVLASCADLAADLRVGLPADHQATFAQLVGMPWPGARQALAGPARYVTLLEIGYAVHEPVFALLFLVIVAIPFRRGERWAWWACWAVLVANVTYSLTFGRVDPTVHRQSLIADIALPLLLLAQVPRCFGGGRARLGGPVMRRAP